MAEKVKFGIVGIGNMGSSHLENFLAGYMPEMELVAVCDIKPARLEWAKEKMPEIKTFDNASDLFDSGLVEAVIIATPHYFHPPLVIEALNKGLHVMSEKPAGVYTKQVREMNEVAAKSDKVFGIMYNQRTNPVYRKVKELVSSGEYGELRRVNWIITSWFRTQAYYNSGGWRATWSGEGGGVLLNQCPHQLDLWQWICGMPSKVRAVCREGKWHDIEVEDDVMIYVEYPNGASGTFSTTTGDNPGSNRLEITLDKAKIVVEEDDVSLYVLETGTEEYIYHSEDGFKKNKGEYVEVKIDEQPVSQHSAVLNAFIANILRGEKLIASGLEGINGLTISNCAFLSSWLDKEIVLPIDEDLYYSELQKKVAGSVAKAEVKDAVQADMKSTF